MYLFLIEVSVSSSGGGYISIQRQNRGRDKQKSPWLLVFITLIKLEMDVFALVNNKVNKNYPNVH